MLSWPCSPFSSPSTLCSSASSDRHPRRYASVVPERRRGLEKLSVYLNSVSSCKIISSNQLFKRTEWPNRFSIHQRKRKCPKAKQQDTDCCEKSHINGIAIVTKPETGSFWLSCASRLRHCYLRHSLHRITRLLCHCRKRKS